MMKKIVDGNGACSNIAYLFSEVCSIYPITPSSPMASNIDKMTNTDVNNLFNAKPKVLEMESEAGAAGALHGALLTGSLATTFTASQGLLLMIPNMYKIAGEMLPAVFHVAARSIATQSLSIFGDHQDIYATRATGFCMLASTNVFDAQNLAAVAHLSAIEGSLPFIHFFDGFRTSHEYNTIEDLPINEVLKLVNYDKINEFKNRVLHVNANKQFGMAENEDIYFQSMEARNSAYNKMPDIVNDKMEEINKIMGTNYKPFNYYGKDDATNVIVAMGSVCDTVKLVIDKLNKEGHKLGLVEVHLYRPFSKKYLENVLPKSVNNIAVLDMTKESGSVGEPLYLDVLATLGNKYNIVGGRYGLSSKNTTPDDVASVYKMLENELKNNFTIGIIDDVTNLSLSKVELNLKENDKSLKIYGFGSDGMVSTSKDLLKLVNKKLGYYVQGYFEYDSKKSGGVTVSNLRFSDQPINKPYYVTKSLITVVTKFEYFYKYEMLDSLDEGGTLLISTDLNEEEIKKELPSKVKNIILDKKLNVLFIDADELALKHNLKGKISKIMEMVILHLMDLDDAKNELIESIKNQFKTKGEEIINNNIAVVNEAIDNIKVLKIDFNKEEVKDNNEDDIFSKIMARKGNLLTVKDCLAIKDGSFPIDLSKREKRNIAIETPVWHPENCIECGQCSLVCPHAVIRNFVSKDKDGIPLLGNNDYNFKVLISTLDCTGCGSCVNVCPGKNGKKALTMESNVKDSNVKEYFENYENPNVIDKYTVRGSQLQKPLMEFSGACAGCGETPYIKLLTQVVGPRLIIANATGCSSIYGGSAPSTPYLIPWANSLFEDNAEFSLGMKISLNEKKKRIENIMKESIDSVDNKVKELYDIWLKNSNDYEKTLDVKNKLEKETIPKDLKDLLNYVPSSSVWAVGGDGWAYDIGYGGLDHILHSNENINVLVLDTEVYSNTGGQASKSTKLGAVAEFANMGKKTSKKDLFRIAMAIPNCYVGSICLGSNMFQAIKTLKEAEEHDGPSIVIAYSPCIEQGIKTGMGCSITEEKLAVECGYTMLMRYNPIDELLTIDSKEPNFDKYMDFLNNEVRFNALVIKNKKYADEVLEEQKQNAIKRYNYYYKMTQKNEKN
jgi:pyruvate-ferredoxin/flavodoxin oxidoreductase